jgi:hypothetical protein
MLIVLCSLTRLCCIRWIDLRIAEPILLPVNSIIQRGKTAWMEDSFTCCIEVHTRMRVNVPRRQMYITKVTSKEDFSHREQSQRRIVEFGCPR